MLFRSTLAELQHQLRTISESEKINITDESLMTIARNASGCMRDAISLLDQIYSFKGNDIAYEDVLLILGATNVGQLYALMAAFFDKDHAQTLSLVTKICEEGGDVVQLIQDIIQVLKQILYVKMNLKDFIDLDEEGLKKIKSLSEKVSLDDKIGRAHV